MKRSLTESIQDVAEYSKRLEELSREFQAIATKKETTQTLIKEIERSNALQECKHYLDKAQFWRIPMIRRRSPALVESFGLGTNLSDCLHLEDIAPLIVRYLGPIELTQLSRINTFLPIIRKAFWMLALDYLVLYTGDVRTCTTLLSSTQVWKEFIADETLLKKLVADMLTKEESTRPPLSSMLALWHHFFVVYRLYTLIYSPDLWNGKLNYTKKFTFVHSRVSDSYTPLTEMNLYKLSRYKEACVKFDDRCQSYNTSLEQKEKLYYFTYNELSELNVLSVAPRFEITKFFILIVDDEIRWLSDEPVSLHGISRFNKTWYTSEVCYTSFFDHTEVRFALDRRRRSPERKPFNPHQDSIAEHVERVIVA